MRLTMRDTVINAITVLVLGALFVATGVVAVGILQLAAVEHDLETKIFGINGHIFVQSADTPLADGDTLVAQLRTLTGVRLAIPLVEFAAGVSSETQQTGALVRGIRGRDLKTLPGIVGHVVSGTLETFDRSGGVAIGQELADNLGVRVGDLISILIAKGSVTPFGTMPRIKSYPVAATFRIGMKTFDGLYVFMPLLEAQAFANHNGDTTVIEVFLERASDVDRVHAEIAAAAAQPLVLTDWRERNKTFFDAQQTEFRWMGLVFGLLAVATAGMAAVVWRLVASGRASFPPQA